jgi:hypothetical protein
MVEPTTTVTAAVVTWVDDMVQQHQDELSKI